MESTVLPLSKITSFLYDYIKNSKDFSLQKVAQEAMGLQYQNFHKRLRANNLKIEELEKIVSYLGLDINITLGDMSFSNMSEDGPPGAGNKDLILRVISLQDAIIRLEKENAELKVVIIKSHL